MPLNRKSVAVLLGLWTILNIAGTALLSRHRAETGEPHAAAHDAHADGGAPLPTPVPGAARTTLTLPADAHEAVLGEMRVMLGSMQGVLHAAAAGDSAALSRAALASGLGMAADPELEALLPAEWMSLALATHRAFDSLAAAGPDPRSVTERLAGITGYCNTCHDMYRLESR